MPWVSPTGHGKTCTQRQGLSHRNIYEDHSSCQMDGLGGENGARNAVRRHPREPRLGGGVTCTQMVAVWWRGHIWRDVGDGMSSTSWWTGRGEWSSSSLWNLVKPDLCSLHDFRILQCVILSGSCTSMGGQSGLRDRTQRAKAQGSFLRSPSVGCPSPATKAVSGWAQHRSLTPHPNR